MRLINFIFLIFYLQKLNLKYFFEYLYFIIA